MDSTATSPKLAGDPSEIGGYPIVLTLVPGQSWLARAEGGAVRTLVLKALDEDCLWKGQLHPNVKDRLGRVRELAHAGVANLYGVERDAGLTYLVWEFVVGDTLADSAKSATCTQRDFLMLARDLVLAVEMLHARGIVHGTLKPTNVIVTEGRRVVITHVSPLLYSEPGDDVQGVIALLAELAEARGEADSPLGRLLTEVSGEEISPRRLATRMGALLESRDADASEQPADQPAAKRIRRRAMLGATATAMLAVTLFVGVKQYAMAKTPRAPKPPEAGREALRAPAAPTARDVQ
jgi:hypothetical protein